MKSVEDDDLTTNITPFIVSPGGTSGTWSEDSDEVRREQNKLLMSDDSVSKSDQEMKNKSVSIAQRDFGGADVGLKPEAISNKRMAINILKKRATDSKGSHAERRTGKGVQKSIERLGEHELKHQDGKTKHRTHRGSQSQRRNTGKGATKGPRAIDENSAAANETPKSSAAQSSRRLSRTKSGSKIPPTRSTQSPPSPSPYNLRRTSQPPSSPSNYNLRRRPAS